MRMSVFCGQHGAQSRRPSLHVRPCLQAFQVLVESHKLTRLSYTCFCCSLTPPLPLPQAFQLLVENHKLTNAEELELVASLPIPPQHQWLQHLYRSKCKKYEQAGSTEASLGACVGPWDESRQSDTGDRVGGR